MSDSHGGAQITQRAANMLVDQGADVLLHLGDIGTAEVIESLLVAGPQAGQIVPVRLVFGNTDWDEPALARHARNLGIRVDHPTGRIELGAGVLKFMHGHDQRAMHQALQQKVAYLCYGHTHTAADHRQGPTRLINPGALFRARQLSIGLLDTNRDELSFLQLTKG